ncbi:hypothetical protein ACFV1N_42110 [Streptosporangium canum]|uniref:hypothetical protein n=1 Tax=Streptosporangium canum TaxID=324952 RepID=UPI00369E6BED
MTPLPAHDRWASLPSAGRELTPDQRLIVVRMAGNAERAIKKLQQRWQGERTDQAPR